MGLTKEQEAIITSKAKKLVISASAGSGKTHVLIEKLIDLICKQNVSVDRLLVLTFTKVASEEIMSRLNSAILKQTQSPHLIDQLDNLPLSDISTIDSFCEKIIKRNINKLNLDENFIILDEKSSKKLKKLAFLRSYQYFSLNCPQEFDEIYLSFKKNKDLIEESVYYLEDYLSSSEDQTLIDNLERNIKDYDEKAVKFLHDYLSERISRLPKILQLLNDVKLTPAEANLFDALLNFSNISTNVEFFDLVKNFESLNPLPSLGGRHKEEIKRVFDLAKHEIQECFDISEEFRCLPSDYKEKVEMLPKALINFYKHYKRLYTSLKEKRSSLDFADIEHLAKKLLEDDEIKKNLQEKYDYIFIDEYQDTNRLQESILKPIGEGGYFTCIGDIKQGIYGFRNASMEIMQEDIVNFKKLKDGDALFLRGNFRTDDSILQFVNDVFKILMTPGSVGIDYAKTSKLKGLTKFKKDNFSPVIVDVIRKEKDKILPFEGIYSVRDDILDNEKGDKREALTIVKRIEDFLGNKIYDSKAKKFRIIREEDISLLFRGRSNLMKEVYTLLMARGHQVTADLKEPLIEDNQIALICALLKLTLNIDDDFSLSAVLCSPFGNFSLNELALMLCDRKANLSDIVKNSGEEKIVAFRDMLDELKFDIQIHGVIKALCRLFDKFSYYDYLKSLSNGKEKISNINSLYKMIRSSGLDNSAAGVINALETLKTAKENSEGGGNAILLTTIHSTKGLEYPIVILCDCGESFKKAYKKSYCLSKEFGLGCKICDFENMTRISTPAFLAGRLVSKKREFIDELMIFYVAMTRAQNHLVIVGKEDEKKLTFDNLNDQSSYLKLIFYALGEGFASQLFSQNRIVTQNREFNVIDEVEVEESKDEKQKNKIEKFIEEKKEYLNYKYKGLEECSLSFKNSVTGAMKLNDEKILITKNDDENVNRQQAILRGNAYHEALKILDFDKIEKKEDIDCNYLQENLTEGYYSLIDFDILFKNILIIKEATKGCKLIKEREFIMECSPNEVDNSFEIDYGNKLIVQGIIDLFAMGEELILIDYKYSSLDSTSLKEKYAQQIRLYCLALEKAFNKKVDKKYLLSLKDGNLILLDK